MTHEPINEAAGHETKSFDTVIRAERGDSLEAGYCDSNGDPIPSIPVEKFDRPLAKSYAAYIGIAEDLQEADEALACLLSAPDNNYTIRRSLVVTSIVSYARCFAQADGRGVKLEARKPWIAPHTDQQRWHKLLMDMRNQLVAHAGQSPFRRIDTAVLVNSVENATEVKGVTWIQFNLVAFEKADIESTRTHIKRLLVIVNNKAQEISDRILERARIELIKKPNVT